MAHHCSFALRVLSEPRSPRAPGTTERSQRVRSTGGTCSLQTASGLLVWEHTRKKDAERSYPYNRKKADNHGAPHRANWCLLNTDIWYIIIDILAQEKYNPVAICMLKRSCRTLRHVVGQHALARQICRVHERLYSSAWVRASWKLSVTCNIANSLKIESEPGSCNATMTHIVLYNEGRAEYRKVLGAWDGFIKSAVMSEGIVYALVVLYKKRLRGLNLITFCFRSESCHRLWPQSDIPENANTLALSSDGQVIIVCKRGHVWCCKPIEL